MRKGQRLKPGALAVTVGDKNIAELTGMSIEKLRISERTEANESSDADRRTDPERDQFQNPVSDGCRTELSDTWKSNWNTVRRRSTENSSGDSDRFRLVGVAYILDEPSIGLHQRDNDKLLGTLKHLRDLGNSVIVVEHDEDTMREADFIVDIGPGAESTAAKWLQREMQKKSCRMKNL